MLVNDYCIIITIYDGKKHLQDLIHLIQEDKSLQRQAFFIIDDCSKENYKDELEKLEQLNSHIRYFRNKKNLGLHRSIAQAINLSEITELVTLDQDYVPLLPQLIKDLEDIKVKENELVYLKVEKQERKLIRKLASKVTLTVIRLFGNIRLSGLYSIRILRKNPQNKIALKPHLILDLHLLKQGFIAKYVDSKVNIIDKGGRATLLNLTFIFFNITLFYTWFFEISIIGLCVLLIALHKYTLLCFILPLIIILGHKWLNLLRNE